MKTRDSAWFLHENDDTSELDNFHKLEAQAAEALQAVSTVVEAHHYRRGESVLIRATVHNCYTDADAARKRGDDGRRLDLMLASGKVVLSVPASDLD